MIAILVIVIGTALCLWTAGVAIYNAGYVKGYEDASDFAIERLKAELRKRPA